MFSLRGALRGVSMVCVLVAMTVAASMFVACSESNVDEPDKTITEGVELPTNQSRTCGLDF